MLECRINLVRAMTDRAEDIKGYNHTKLVGGVITSPMMFALALLHKAEIALILFVLVIMAMCGRSAITNLRRQWQEHQFKLLLSTSVLSGLAWPLVQYFEPLAESQNRLLIGLFFVVQMSLFSVLSGRKWVR